MTTGATIHTTEGLKMTVTRRTMPPIIPNLGTKILRVDGDQSLSLTPSTVSSSLSEEDQEGEVSTARIP